MEELLREMLIELREIKGLLQHQKDLSERHSASMEAQKEIFDKVMNFFPGLNIGGKNGQ